MHMEDASCKESSLRKSLVLFWSSFELSRNSFYGFSTSKSSCQRLTCISVSEISRRSSSEDIAITICQVFVWGLFSRMLKIRFV